MRTEIKGRVALPLMLLVIAAQLVSAQQLQRVRLAIPGDGNSADFKALPAKLNTLFKDNGYAFDVVAAANDADAVKMAVDGEVDVAETDAAGVLGLESELQNIAVMINGDGRTFYTAQAYVRSDSTDINSYADLRGKKSCHTGFRKSAGMYMPLGYGIRNGYVEPKRTLKETVVSFFSDSCAAPEICGLCLDSNIDGQCAADGYSDYSGALRCLSEKRGDVAFIKDNTYESTCGSNVASKPAFCLAANQLRKLVDVGQVPSHMLVASSAANAGLVTGLRAAFVQKVNAANSGDLKVLMDGSIGFTDIPIARHMETYGATAACVPEIAPSLECNVLGAPAAPAASAVIKLAIPGDGNSADFKALPAKLNALFRDNGYTFDLVAAASDADAVKMAVDGEVDVAETDSAGVLGMEDRLQTVAVMINGDGRTFYTAQAYVRSDSTGINSYADLRGKKSCHTGFRKSAGMYMPLGYGIRNGYVEPKRTLKETVVSFFSDSCAAPEICGLCLDSNIDGQCAADGYSDYSGALRCLSEKRGDVAFIKDSTYESTCGSNVASKPAFCLAANQLRKLADVGPVPSHMLVASSAANAGLVTALRTAFVQKVNAANTNDLKALMDGAIGFTNVPITRHMETYDATAACVPEVATSMECNVLAGNGTMTEETTTMSAEVSSVSDQFNELQSEVNTALDVAIAGLIIAIISLAAIPGISFLMARALVAKQQNKVNMMIDSRRSSVASHAPTDSARLV